MKETHRTLLTQAAMSSVRARISCAPVMLLCFVCGVTGSSFLFGDIFFVRAAQYRTNSVEGIRPLVMNRPRLVSFAHALATSSPSEDHLWREKGKGIGKSVDKFGALPESYRALSLNEIAQREVLRHAPMGFSRAATQAQVIMALPMPDGTLARFRVEESPVLAPLLAARFPAIKTYRGRGLDDPTATTRFDVTPAGFHAIVLSARGTVIIEPAARGQAGNYVSYDQRDAPRDTPKDEGSFYCLVSDTEQSLAQPQNKQSSRRSAANLNTPTGTTLRTYRLALAATAEYTQTYGGGTVAGALSAITTTINAVDAIYERDVAIRLILIDSETSIIFTNTATDGYTSDNASSLLIQNQVILDQRIGPANYDIGFVLDGHVYAYQPGHFLFQGQGQFQSVCANGQKGKGVSILRSIEPSTISAIWDVAHEMGHQFGALHTFNGTTEDCGPSRFADFAYEPGSGSTIMAYRGGFAPDGIYLPLCGAEDLHSTDTYFHTASIEQIVNYTTYGNGSFCPSLTSTGNSPPNIDPGADHTIPAYTPFALTATGSDPEGDALTYCWEEFDLGAPGPPNTDGGNRPIFRSFAPAPSPMRTFPQMSDILSGAATFGESLPTTARTMNFRVTVRDNHPGGGGVNAGSMRLNVVDGGGPFAITLPSSATTWTTSSTQTVTWNTANTAMPPVSCPNVRVLLSIDGGNTFPITLVADTPNTGTATVIVPNLPTSTARVKVEAIGNIFFNISAPNFEISGSGLPPVLLGQDNTTLAAALNSVLFTRAPFPQTSVYNFSSDLRTHITLFAVGLELRPGEDASFVSAQLEDNQHGVYTVAAEYVGKVPGFDWLTQLNLRLPEGMAPGDVQVNINLRGAASNKVVIAIR